MSLGLYSGSPGLSVGIGLYQGSLGLFSGSPGLISGNAPSLYLLFTQTETLDPRITFTRASSATRVNSSGLVETVSSNVARFDYDPVTMAAKGLLIEEQRTNLLTYSNTLSDVNWIKTNITIGAAITGPDGAASLAKVEATTTSLTNMYKVVGAAGSASGNTYSIYAKKGSGATDANTFILRNSTTATNLVILAINYDTGALTYGVGTGPATAVACGNGIWRIPITATSGISAGDGLIIYVGFDGSSKAAGTHAYIGFAQLEAGAFTTSYIPTTSATVTRAADVASMTGTNFSSWFNASEGTFLVEADIPTDVNGAVGNYFFAASDGTTSNTILIAEISGGVGQIVTGGAAQFTSSVGSPTASARKYALAYKANDTVFCVAGTLGTTDTSVTLPAVDRLILGARGDLSGISPLNGHIRRLTYYPARLSNALSQTLST